jgi:hypothetical protein
MLGIEPVDHFNDTMHSNNDSSMGQCKKLVLRGLCLTPGVLAVYCPHCKGLVGSSDMNAGGSSSSWACAASPAPIDRMLKVLSCPVP